MLHAPILVDEETAAIARANEGYALAYGEDAWTERIERIQQLRGPECDPLLAEFLAECQQL